MARQNGGPSPRPQSRRRFFSGRRGWFPRAPRLAGESVESVGSNCGTTRSGPRRPLSGAAAHLKVDLAREIDNGSAAFPGGAGDTTAAGTWLPATDPTGTSTGGADRRKDGPRRSSVENKRPESRGPGPARRLDLCRLVAQDEQFGCATRCAGRQPPQPRDLFAVDDAANGRQ